MEDRNIRLLLKQYLLGQAEESDVNAIDSWYGSFDPEAGQLPAKEVVQLSEEEAATIKEEMWAAIDPRRQTKVWRLPVYARVAAMVAIIAGAAVFFTLSRRHHQGSEPIAFTTISTGIGERRTVVIPDGSRLVLDAGTTIRVQDDNSTIRKVEVVDGQVFFDVRTDARRPFVISSGGLTTEVLGTSFTVAAYSALTNISIGVVSGKVSVASGDTVLGVLVKDEELQFNRSSRKYKKTPLDESLTAWQSGRLIFNDLGFDEMAVIMKKNFGVDVVTIDDSVRHTRYTTELDTAMSPLQAAQVLGAIHDLKVTTKDKKIFFNQ